MPRQPRLDAPGLLQHIMALGIERREIFKDDQDRKVTEARNLRSEVYKTAYELSMEIFELSKTWPPEERYALTDQIRRSSRAVCSSKSLPC